MTCCQLPELYPKTRVLQAHQALLRMAPQSVEATRQTAARHPNLPLPHFLLGLAHEGLDQKEQAKARYQQALACAEKTAWPGRWQILLRLAELGE